MHLSTIQLSDLQRPHKCRRTTDHPKSFASVPFTINPALVADSRAGPVDDKLYSGFIEHLGRGIYGGLVDNPKDPSPAELLDKQETDAANTKGRAGWRKDVRKLVAKDGDLEIPMMRWPGGNYVSNYHWQDGIGPIADRPRRVELAWLSDESNQFGTDEFIDMCRAYGWEPYICLNMGTGTYEEALAWVEYCNGTGNTHWANLRRKNTGRDEPHAVKYWGLGNEMWGPWQVGNLNATDYASKARQWAHGVKLVDPTVKLISCGETGWSDWDREVLQAVVPFVDLHSIHFYTMIGHEKHSEPGNDYEKNVFGPAAAERAITITKSLIDLANIDNTCKGIPARDVLVCYDEWNVWDTVKAPGSNGLEQTYDYTDMLGVAAWLAVFVRKHRDIGIACLAQTVNVIAPIMTTPNGLLKQTLYWPLRYFSKYMKNGHVLALPSMSDTYGGPTYPSFIQQIHEQPAYIDMVAVAVKTDNGHSIRLSVLNRHPELEWRSPLKFDGFEVAEVKTVEVYHDDLAAANTFDNPEVVVPTETTVSGKEWKGEVAVKKHSWQFIMFEGVAK